MSEEFDVAIIGGGPAGSTAAILLAQKGHKVVVLEREKFPRFHIGESLLPYSMDAFAELGIQDWLEEHAVEKHGGEIATADGQRAVKFYFKDGFRLQHKKAYQVERANFDRKLLERAEECGTRLMMEVEVKEVDLRENGVIIHLAGGGQMTARYVIDASGRNSLLGRQLGLKYDYPHLKKFSCYAHFEGVQRDCGIDAGLTRLVRGRENWFWLIPISETRTSVGVVMDTEAFRNGRRTPEEALDGALEASELMSQRMQSAMRTTAVHSAGDYSYRNRRMTGSRWMLAGDAAGFIDPIFSTGVFLAIHSGGNCARALDRALRSPGSRRWHLLRYERKLHRLMDTYLRFVTAWYQPEFIEVFTSPTQRWQIAPAINAVLAGNVGGSFAIWWRMRLFYLVLFLQRFLPLCPRLKAPESSHPELSPTVA